MRGRAGGGRRAAALVAVAALASVACGGGGGAAREGQSPSPLLQDPDAPYVVTAVDNHFHDAHPSEPIALGRMLIVKNEGRNLHNVTIEGTTYSRDVRPGDRLTIDLGALVPGTGRYRLVCAYHVGLGMEGVLVVTEAP